jgi:Flp pilus assembly protein TadG
MTIRQVRTAVVSRCSQMIRGASRSRIPSSRRATAAMEFAVASPLLIIMLGGAADYGQAQFQRSALANAVAAGAEYAYKLGALPTTTNANVATVVISANITSVVQAVFSSVTAQQTAVTVSYASISPGVPSPGWYCITGTGPTVTSVTGPGVCTDGSSAGYYISFKASYTNTGIMNGFRSASSNTMSEQATVKVR